MYSFIVYKYPSLSNPSKDFEVSLYKKQNLAEQGFVSAVEIAKELAKASTREYVIKLVEVVDYKETVKKEKHVRRTENI